MRNKFLFLSTVVATCIFSAGTITAADSRHPRMPGGGGQRCNPMTQDDYNSMERMSMDQNTMPNMYTDSSPAAKKLQTDSVETFKGTVKSVKQDRYPDGRMFIVVILDTSDGDKSIMVGPASFVNQSKVKLQVGDKITVKGYRVGANGEEVITAQEIDKNGNILKLLNEQRQPLYGDNNGQGGMMNGNGRH